MFLINSRQLFSYSLFMSLYPLFYIHLMIYVAIGLFFYFNILIFQLYHANFSIHYSIFYFDRFIYYLSFSYYSISIFIFSISNPSINYRSVWGLFIFESISSSLVFHFYLKLIIPLIPLLLIYYLVLLLLVLNLLLSNWLFP